MRKLGWTLLGALVVAVGLSVWYFAFDGKHVIDEYRHKHDSSTAAAPKQPHNFPVIDNPPPVTADEVKSLEQTLNKPTANGQKPALIHELRKSHTQPMNLGGPLKLDYKSFRNNKVSGYLRGSVGSGGVAKYYTVQLVYEKGQREPHGKWLVMQVIPEGEEQ